METSVWTNVGIHFSSRLIFNPCVYFADRTFFTGKQRDSVTGFDYFGARYYDSTLSRWLSPDKPFKDQHIQNPQTWNLYQYCSNNPVNRFDPNGEDDYKVFLPTNSYVLSNADRNHLSKVVQKSGHTIEFIQGNDATVQRYQKALNTPTDRVIFAGHTTTTNPVSDPRIATGVKLVNGTSYGESGVIRSENGAPNVKSEDIKVQANTVAVFGCDSFQLCYQYSSTNFIGVDSGPNGTIMSGPSGAGLEALIIVDANTRPAGSTAPVSDAAVSAANQAVTTAERNGGLVPANTVRYIQKEETR